MRRFEVRGIVELGSSTFGATGTSTVTLFLKRRPDDFAQDCEFIADDLILGLDPERKGDFVNSREVFEAYCAHLGLPPDDYRSLVTREPTDGLRESEFYGAYRRWFEGLTDVKNFRKSKTFVKMPPDEQQRRIDRAFFDAALDVERDKFLTYLLAHRLEVHTDDTAVPPRTTRRLVPQQTLLVKSGRETDTQRAFLGYSFSDRRGAKGLSLSLDALGRPLTKLYDEADYDNPEKVNAHLYRHLADLDPHPLPDALAEHLTRARLVDCFNFERVEFEKQIGINTERKKKAGITSQWPSVEFSSVATLEYGSALKEESRVEGEFPVVGSNGIVGYHNEFLIEGPAIVVGRKGSAGKINLIDKNCFPIDTTFYVRLDQEKVLLGYLLPLMKLLDLEELGAGVGVPGLNRNDVHNLKIPLPPKPIQEQIVAEMEAIEREETAAQKEAENAKLGIREIVNSLYQDASLRQPINSVFFINESATNPAKTFGDSLFTYVDIDSVGKGTGVISFDKKMAGTAAPSRARRLAADDSVLLSTVRPNLRGFAYLETVPDKTVFSTGFAIFRSKGDYPARLLYYLFQYADDLMQQLIDKMPKASYPSVNERDIEGFQIPAFDASFPDVLKRLTALEATLAAAQTVLAGAEARKAEVMKKYL